MTFLICSERGGSNLIGSILNCHSLVSAPPPYHLCRDVGLNLHATLEPNLRSPAWHKVIGKIAASIKQLNSEIVAARFLHWYGSREKVNFKDILDYV